MRQPAPATVAYRFRCATSFGLNATSKRLSSYAADRNSTVLPPSSRTDTLERSWPCHGRIWPGANRASIRLMSISDSSLTFVPRVPSRNSRSMHLHPVQEALGGGANVRRGRMGRQADCPSGTFSAPVRDDNGLTAATLDMLIPSTSGLDSIREAARSRARRERRRDGIAWGVLVLPIYVRPTPGGL